MSETLSEQLARISQRVGALETEQIGSELPLTVILKSYSTLGLKVKVNVYKHKYYKVGQSHLGISLRAGMVRI